MAITFTGPQGLLDLAIVVTSKDANLTKAHARHLESRFIALAQQAARCRLDNGTAPEPLPLPEADVSDMESPATVSLGTIPAVDLRQRHQNPRSSEGACAASWTSTDTTDWLIASDPAVNGARILTPWDSAARWPLFEQR
jgi:hypothetical protein